MSVKKTGQTTLSDVPASLKEVLDGFIEMLDKNPGRVMRLSVRWHGCDIYCHVSKGSKK